MITTVQFLTQDECTHTQERLHQLRSQWIPRHAILPYYTFGATSYLDDTDPAVSGGYYSVAQQYNPLLQKNFGWIYERLIQTLANTLEAPVMPHEGFALPGFHIFLADKLYEDDQLAYIHYDLQYLKLAWQDREGVDFKSPISFTLAISLPKYGGGMYIWDAVYEDTKNRPDEEVEKMRDTKLRRYHEYSRGQLFVHSGHFLHQIAPFFDVQPEDERITLQGHAIRHPDGWHYYW